MIHDVTMYKCHCDGCNREAEDGTDFYAWADPGQAIERAEYDGWIDRDGKQYCPDCYCVECEKPGKPCDDDCEGSES